MLNKCNKEDVSSIARIYMGACGYFPIFEEESEATYFVNVDNMRKNKKSDYALCCPSVEGDADQGIAESFIKYIEDSEMSEEDVMMILMTIHAEIEKSITTIVEQTKSVIIT